MRQTLRFAATLAVLGAMVASAAACAADADDPAGGEPTAAPTSPASPADPGEAVYDFPEIKSLVDSSSDTAFTADYDAAVDGSPPTSVTLVRQAPVTALLMDRARLVWTADDAYACQVTGAEQQCLRKGGPSESEDPAAGPDRDWAAVLADAGFQMLSPVGTWQFLEGLGRDGAAVVESSQTIAGQASTCVELTNEAPTLDWTGTVTACFTDRGVISRYVIELSSGGQSQQLSAELTGYTATADPQAVEVPEDAPLGG
jgi:hypothetical protein